MCVGNKFFSPACVLSTFFAVLACCVPLQLDALMVTGNGFTINNGDTTPQVKDGTDFGLEAIGFYKRNTFTIVNNGSASITILNIIKEDDFPLPPPYTVYKHSFFIYDITPGELAPGESCTFSVSFGPLFYEAGKASIVISYSYKLNNYQYRFAVAGETDEILPRIRVYQYGGIEVPNQLVSAYQENVAPPCFDNCTDFGAIPVEDGKPNYQLSTVFVITNTGPSSISIYNGTGGDPVHVTGDQDDFSVILQPTITSIPPGGTSFFMVLFDPTVGGVRNAEISFNYNDGWKPSYFDNDTYIFSVTGVGQAPEINIPQVLTGGTYNFGIVPVSSGAKTVSFTVENQGLYELDLTGDPRVAVSGTHAADFSVISVPSSPVAPGGESTFSIRFDPSAGGVRSATISIANNDANESPYTFIVQGTGGRSGNGGEW
jgi:trimeric autotransporter adhesin